MKSNKLSKKEMLGYGIGDAAQGFSFQAINLFILFFYTDVFGISAAAASTLFLIARLWDAFNDPIMGAIIDKTHTKWGKFRPYLLWGIIPFTLFSILCFVTPGFTSTKSKLIYAYVTYIGYGMMYTMVNVPYGALTSAMTQDSDERGILSVVRSICGIASTLVVSIAIPVLTVSISGGNLQKGYAYTMIILALMGAVLMLITFASTKERYSAKGSNAKMTFKGVMNLLKSNKPLKIICIAYLIVFGNTSITSAVGVYYWKYNLNRMDLFGVNMSVGVLVTLLTMFFIPKILSKGIEKKNIFILGMLISLFRPITVYTGNIPIIFMGAIIGSIGSGLMIGVLWGLVPDTIEYGEYHTGIRAEGITYAVVGFFNKLGMALGGLIPGFVLQWTGYVPEAVQSPQALKGIITLVATIPIVLILLFVIIMWRYPLDSKTYEHIVKELNERKSVGVHSV